MTKLDGTARGGILVAIADKFALPVHFIGVGEGVDDLEPFAARDFADAIAGDRERGGMTAPSETKPPMTGTAAPSRRKALNPMSSSCSNWDRSRCSSPPIRGSAFSPRPEF